MNADAQALAAERRFFGSLLAAEAQELDAVLADEFLLIDFLTGSEIPKAARLAAVNSRTLSFDAIDVLDSRVRLYGPAAIVPGQTHMAGRYEDTPLSTHRRYTHVYIETEDGWRLAAAQSTPIAGGPAV